MRWEGTQSSLNEEQGIKNQYSQFEDLILDNRSNRVPGSWQASSHHEVLCWTDYSDRVQIGEFDFSDDLFLVGTVF